MQHSGMSADWAGLGCGQDEHAAVHCVGPKTLRDLKFNLQGRGTIVDTYPWQLCRSWTSVAARTSRARAHRLEI